MHTDLYICRSTCSLMKESQMLVSKCVILNVIKATSSQPTLSRYVYRLDYAMLVLSSLSTCVHV